MAQNGFKHHLKTNEDNMIKISNNKFIIEAINKDKVTFKAGDKVRLKKNYKEIQKQTIGKFMNELRVFKDIEDIVFIVRVDRRIHKTCSGVELHPQTIRQNKGAYFLVTEFHSSYYHPQIIFERAE